MEASDGMEDVMEDVPSRPRRLWSAATEVARGAHDELGLEDHLAMVVLAVSSKSSSAAVAPRASPRLRTDESGIAAAPA